MKLVAGDYLILDLSRPSLAKCVSIEKPYRAILERDRDNSEGKVIPVEFKMSDVLANLGRSPKAGSVHGVKVEPLFRTEGSKFFEGIRVYQDMSEERFKQFRSEMIRFVKTVKQKGLQGPNIELEIRPVSGKYAGYYKFRPKVESDIMCIRPNETLDELQYIFAHEYGHSVHYRMVPKPMWLRWVKKYHDHVSVFTINDDELVQIREEIEELQSLREYLKECNEETKDIIKACLRHISHLHGLTKMHLELMLTSGESIEELWPTLVDLSNKDMKVSEYAQKAPEEFFAECFAFHFLGRKLPADLSTLMEKTLQRLAN